MSTNEFEFETQLDVHLTFNNQAGSVEHYFHFLLGLLLPMVLVCEKLIETGKIRYIYIRSCAILDDHIRSLGYPEIVILDKRVHSEIKESKKRLEGSTLSLQFFEIDGLDSPGKYSRESFESAVSILRSKLSEELIQVENGIRQRYRGRGPKVLLVDRSEPHKYYSSDACELKSSGSQRRSIENFSELQSTISALYPNTIVETLEGKSLVYQIALFSSVDVVIAQHGAALANLVWCVPDANLIEIFPDNMQRGKKTNSEFTRLSACMSLGCQMIHQEDVHGPVDAKLMLDALLSIYPVSQFKGKLQQIESVENISETKMRFDRDRYPVYGDEYELVVHENELFIQHKSTSMGFKLNSSAACIFNYCLGNKTIGEIIDAIYTEYASTESIGSIINDVQSVLAALIEKGVVELSKHKPFPDFLIIGAMKSGTSALNINLAYHPEVKMVHEPEWREINFFSVGGWGLGPIWYRKHFTRDGLLLQGEKSPEYLSEQQAMLNMYSILPDAKLIVLLRDPVTRAYSHWNHFNQIPEQSAGWGWEVCDFEDSLEIAELGVLKRGFYVEQLEYLFKLYSREQVFIGIAERFRADGDHEFEKVCNFLNIKSTTREYGDVHVREYDFRMSDDMIKKLTDFYRPHNEALFDLLGYRIEEWH